MNRYGAIFILYLALWLILALTPAFCAVFARGGDGGLFSGIIEIVAEDAALPPGLGQAQGIGEKP